MENKDKLTILPIIYQHVLSIVMVQKCTKVHKTVIYKREFIAQDITHAKYIENEWSNLKAHLKHIRGSQGQMLDGHVDEFVYRYNRKTEGKVLDLMLINIATFYPVH